MVGDGDLHTTVTAVIQGDELAWQRLWRALEPTLLRMLAQPRVFGRLSQREDDRRDVFVAVMGGFAQITFIACACTSKPSARAPTSSFRRGSASSRSA
jgi:hypothetical protein